MLTHQLLLLTRLPGRNLHHPRCSRFVASFLAICCTADAIFLVAQHHSDLLAPQSATEPSPTLPLARDTDSASGVADAGGQHITADHADEDTYDGSRRDTCTSVAASVSGAIR
jgi:hypothetical protein